MISKLRFSLIAVVMLVLLGFGFQNQAQGQVGLNGLFCPAIPHTTGILETQIVGSGAVTPDFTGALIGTVENSGADAVAGLDWHHVDETEARTPTPTNETGSQLVTWWTQIDDRNTYLQVTNAIGSDVDVHVRIHNQDCAEIRDFCDTYTGYDTHEYNFSDLVANNGADIGDANLQGVEGWLVVTAVKDCGTQAEQALNWNYLAGQLIIFDADDYLYGVNTYARQAICDDVQTITEVNRVANGSFQDGGASWSEDQGVAGVINPSVELAPGEDVPPNPYDSPNAAIVITADSNASGTYNPSIGTPTTDLLGIGGADTDVSIWVSNEFSTDVDDSQTLSYNIQIYGPEGDGQCNSWAAVLLLDDDGNNVDGNCYFSQSQPDGVLPNAGTAPGGMACEVLGIFDPGAGLNFGGLNYQFGQRSAFQIGDTLSTDGSDDYIIQVVTGTQACGNDNPTTDFAALVNGFELDGTDIEIMSCQEDLDGCLDGSDYAKLDEIRPDTLYGLFNILPENAEAGADVVHINFADVYGPPYRPVAAFANVFVGIYDDLEDFQSCGDATVCFVRLGIDDALVLSENFSPTTPTPTPPPPTTVPPTITPTTPPPTTVPPTATPTPGGGGSSSCAIAGSPVQLGTALANVLIPLVPVAFAFGVRAVRRRKK